MKIKDLIAELEELDPEAEVICSNDSEGNVYSPLGAVLKYWWYQPETTYSGIVYGTAAEAEEEEADPDTLEKCIVLFPVN